MNGGNGRHRDQRHGEYTKDIVIMWWLKLADHVIRGVSYVTFYELA